MAILSFVHVSLKSLAAFWALVTLAVAAALMAMLNTDCECRLGRATSLFVS